MTDYEIYENLYAQIKEWENDENAQREYHEWLDGLDN